MTQRTDAMIPQNRSATLRTVTRRVSLILINMLSLLGGQASAQAVGPPADAVDHVSSGHWLLRPVINLDFRDSFIDRHHVNVKGINAGSVVGPRRNQLGAKMPVNHRDNPVSQPTH